MEVADANNLFNTASITVEVAPVASLSWLEQRIERPSDGELAEYALIALDASGRHFSNCSSLSFTLEIKERKIVEINRSVKFKHSTWLGVHERLQQ